MSAQPYISFVTYGRNDGYTADYVARVSRAVRCLAHQLERAELASEIIISEWNPPKDRPLLIEALDIPTGLRHVTIAGVITGAEHHKHFLGADEVGIHVTEAANVGLRRARGEFIVGKSSDTFYSPEVIEKIAGRNLRKDTIYRVDRHDVFVDDPALWDLPDEVMLEKFATMPGNVHGWIQQLPEWGLRELHTNACGDFTLMAARYWKALRGYPRDPTVLALDSDSLVLHAAAALGATECRWPEVVPCLQAGAFEHERRPGPAIVVAVAAAARSLPAEAGKCPRRPLAAQHVRLSQAQGAARRVGHRAVDRAQLRDPGPAVERGRALPAVAGRKLGPGGPAAGERACSATPRGTTVRYCSVP